jgi:hypothetical protein
MVYRCPALTKAFGLEHSAMDLIGRPDGGVRIPRDQRQRAVSLGRTEHGTPGGLVHLDVMSLELV